MGSPAANSWYAIKNAKQFNNGEVTDWSEVGVKALDDKTLEITMDHPLNTFDKTIAVKGLYPLRQDFVEKVGSDKLGSSVDTMLYSGPYAITDWVLDSSMELKKNDLYWVPRTLSQRRICISVEVDDANTKVAMFENGEIDATSSFPASILITCLITYTAIPAAVLCGCGSTRRVPARDL